MKKTNSSFTYKVRSILFCFTIWVKERMSYEQLAIFFHKSCIHPHKGQKHSTFQFGIVIFEVVEAIQGRPFLSKIENTCFLLLFQAQFFWTSMNSQIYCEHTNLPLKRTWELILHKYATLFIQGGCNRLPCCDFSFGLLTSRNATKMAVHTFFLSPGLSWLIAFI